MQKYEIQKVKNSLLKLEKEREIKIRKETEDWFTKQVPLPRPGSLFIKNLHLYQDSEN